MMYITITIEDEKGNLSEDRRGGSYDKLLGIDYNEIVRQLLDQENDL